MAPRGTVPPPHSGPLPQIVSEIRFEEMLPESLKEIFLFLKLLGIMLLLATEKNLIHVHDNGSWCAVVKK